MPHGQRVRFVPPNGWWQLAAVSGTSMAVLAEVTAACCGRVHTTSVLLSILLFQHGVELLPICLCAALAEEIFLFFFFFIVSESVDFLWHLCPSPPASHKGPF